MVYEKKIQQTNHYDRPRIELILVLITLRIYNMLNNPAKFKILAHQVGTQLLFHKKNIFS